MKFKVIFFVFFIVVLYFLILLFFKKNNLILIWILSIKTKIFKNTISIHAALIALKSPHNVVSLYNRFL
jgi:hypothetical protein